MGRMNKVTHHQSHTFEHGLGNNIRKEGISDAKNSTMEFPSYYHSNSETLPFVQKLRLARQLLVNLKNEKLRKFQYSSEHGVQVLSQQKPSESFESDKVKLSVMDMIGSQEVKNDSHQEEPSSEKQQEVGFEKSAKQSELAISSEQKIHLQPPPQQCHDRQKTDVNSAAVNAQKVQVEQERFESPIEHKQKLSAALDSMGFQLQRANTEVQCLNVVFNNLCECYAENKHIVEDNVSLRRQVSQAKEQIQLYSDLLSKEAQEKQRISGQCEVVKKLLSNVIQKHLSKRPYGSLCQRFERIEKSVKSLNDELKEDTKDLLRACSKPDIGFSESQSVEGEDEAAGQLNLQYRMIQSEQQSVQQDRAKASRQSKQAAKKEAFSIQQFYETEMYNLT